MQQVTHNQIWNARGSSATPWVTGVVESLDASTLYAKWDAPTSSGPLSRRCNL